MKIKQQNNITSLTPMNSKNRKQIPTERYDQIYDEQFVSLINSLNESIKEYYKVSKNNIIEANSILNTYEQHSQTIQNWMQEIINTQSYDKIEEFFVQVSKVLEVITQMKVNTNSNLTNLNLFFDDAKILFINMRKKRKEKINSNMKNIQISNTSNDSYPSSNQEKNIHNFPKMNMNLYRDTEENNNQLFNNITKMYSRILKLLDAFNHFNYIISNINVDESNKFNTQQNSIKRELENLFNYLKKNLLINSFVPKNKSSINIVERKNLRSKSIGDSNEVEKLKKMNEANRKKLIELNKQINAYKNKILELDMINNSLNMKLKNPDQKMMINTNPDFNNLLKQKDNQIMNLQKQLNVFQNNEKLINNQMNNLNEQLSEKINQYEAKIADFNEKIKNNKKAIIFLQNKLKTKENEIEKLKVSIKNPVNYDMKKKFEILNMELKEKESKINAMNEELIKCQNEEKINQKRIEDMNNNIFNYEKIIKQKDELINNNYKDNNEVFRIKLENDNLKKQIEELKNINKNNYLSQNQKNRNVNMNSAEIQELKQTLAAINESKTKLELELAKKDDELEGFKQVIFKLQNQLEANKDKEEEQKNRRNTERSEHNKNFKTEVNIKEQNLSSKNLNKSFEMPKDTNTQLMNKFLGQLNEAEKKISLLQNKNKELQFKLDEKQVEKEFSGYRTEDYNFSNYEEEFDLKKMVNGAREKNRSEDINIDYPGVQSVKDKYKELVQHLHLLEEQVKILICNINITSKIKPQINQICQLMRIRAENIQAIIAGKNKKKMLGLVV
jgi:kinetochore protein SLK19